MGKKGTEEKKSKEGRYNKNPGPANYETPKWSESVIDRVKKLEKNGKQGKECLVAFLPEYNKQEGTNYKLIAELGTDDLLTGLLDFIENKEPEDI